MTKQKYRAKVKLNLKPFQVKFPKKFSTLYDRKPNVLRFPIDFHPQSLNSTERHL